MERFLGEDERIIYLIRSMLVILETQGRGHYIGCNLSVTNFTGG
jgi:hypothetical protein